jgi:outer membrane receptor protein involved in Fe transport
MIKRNTLSAAITAALIAAGQSVAVMAQEQAGEAEDATLMEEIIVTATRRESTIIDIPYNISAVSGDFIDAGKILTTSELLRGVPGAAVVDYGVRNAGVVNTIRVRGLSIDNSFAGDPSQSAVAPVSTYLNDTPIYANLVLKDLERVEILRGPQGTLYGSGSLGGTVRYIARRPVLEEFNGRIEGSFSNTDGSSGNNWDANVMLNIPMGESFAARIVAGRLDYAGIVDLPNVYVLDNEGLPVAPNGLFDPATEYEFVRDADTVEVNFARVALLWEPNDRFDALLTYNYQEDETGGRMQPTEGVDGWGDRYAKYENGSVQREPSEREVDALSLEMNFDFGFATLTSSTSWYEHSGSSVSENSGFFAQNGWYALYYYNYPRPMSSAERTYSDEAFVQELRLVSNTEGKIDWIIGGFYRDQDLQASQFSYVRGFERWADAYFGDPSLVITDNDFRYIRDENFEDKAVFGELTWNVSETFRLTGGFRWFDIDYVNDTFQGVGVWYFSPGFDQDVRFTGSDSDTIFKLNASWDINDSSMLYGTISEGYRRGGANAVPLEGLFAEDPRWQLYEPDTTTNYEIGVKGTGYNSFWSVAAFYVDWKDIQQNTATTIWGFFAAINGGDAHTQGVEVEYDKFFGNGWHTKVGYAYTKGELDDTFLSPDEAFVAGVKGWGLPGLAEHTVNFMLEHTLNFDNGWDWNNRLGFYWQDDTKNALTETDPRFALDLDGYALVDFNSTLLINEAWSVGLFVKNLTNERAVSGVFTENWMGTDPSQNYYGSGAKSYIARPRTIGVSATFDF